MKLTTSTQAPRTFATYSPPPEPPAPIVREVEPAALADASEHATKSARVAGARAKKVDELSRKLAEKDRKIADKRAKGKLDDVAKLERERAALEAELTRARTERIRAAEAATRARAELAGARLLVPEDRGPPRDDAEYRRYLASQLGVPEAQLSPALVRFAQAEEAKVVEKATAPFRKFLPDGALTDRGDARRYFDQILGNVDTLARAQKTEHQRRRDWEKRTGERWALDTLPPGAILGGDGPDAPIVRWGTTRAEATLAPVARELVFRLRSTALNGKHPELDGSERSLTDVFDDARYAQALAHKTIEAVETEARARFFEVLRENHGTIELGLSAKEKVDGLKAGLAKLWPLERAKE
ncbi:hypothetical protein L6R52_21995 [Myxococcota bacterium]|nr:hypothetical protein [Myxococcota bacterium]